MRSEDLMAIAEGTPNWQPVGDSQADDADTALRNLALDLASVFRTKTNLIFTNSRDLDEMLADELNQISGEQRWPRNPFLLHHGSLSKEVREDVEQRLKSGEPPTKNARQKMPDPLQRRQRCPKFGS